MEYRELGKTGIRVSAICFGALTMGPLQANFSPERAGEVIAYAFDRGINFVDCAQLYRVYDHVREALRKTKRDDVVICSKSYAYTKQMAVDAVEEARKKLDRDVIDIFMLHEQESIHTFRGHREALDALFEMKAKGVIRAVGSSMHHVAAVEAAPRVGLDVIHPLLNVDGWGIVDGNREQMENAVRNAVDSGIGVFTMKAFGGGNLHHKAKECLRYVISLPGISSTAIGMQSEDEVDANISFFENGDFTPEQENALNQKKRRLHIEDWCVGCGTCVEKCPQGAAEVINGRMSPDPQKCVLCGYCAAYCDMYAIKVL